MRIAAFPIPLSGATNEIPSHPDKREQTPAIALRRTSFPKTYGSSASPAVYFRIGLDVANADLYFESRLGNVQSTGFSFDHFPSLGFPIDQIADYILGAVADMVVNSQALAILNVTRFSVADFDLFKGFGPMKNLLAAHPDPVATTYGVIFEKR